MKFEILLFSPNRFEIVPEERIELNLHERVVALKIVLLSSDETRYEFSAQEFFKKNQIRKTVFSYSSVSIFASITKCIYCVLVKWRRT